MTESEVRTERLDGKIAVVMGVNSGIGLVTAQCLFEEGAFIFNWLSFNDWEVA